MASSAGFLQSTEKVTVFLDLRPPVFLAFFYKGARDGSAGGQHNRGRDNKKAIHSDAARTPERLPRCTSSEGENRKSANSPQVAPNGVRRQPKGYHHAQSRRTIPRRDDTALPRAEVHAQLHLLVQKKDPHTLAAVLTSLTTRSPAPDNTTQADTVPPQQDQLIRSGNILVHNLNVRQWQETWWRWGGGDGERGGSREKRRCGKEEVSACGWWAGGKRAVRRRRRPTSRCQSAPRSNSGGNVPIFLRLLYHHPKQRQLVMR